METIDLVATATQILELLSDQGISGKSLHAYRATMSVFPNSTSNLK